MVVIVNDACSRTLVASGEAFVEATTGSVTLAIILRGSAFHRSGSEQCDRRDTGGGDGGRPGLRGIHPSWTNGAVDPLTDGRRTAGIGGRHYPPEAVALRDGPSALTLSPGVCGTSIRRASPGWTE